VTGVQTCALPIYFAEDIRAIDAAQGLAEESRKRLCDFQDIHGYCSYSPQIDAQYDALMAARNEASDALHSLSGKAYARLGLAMPADGNGAQHPITIIRSMRNVDGVEDTHYPWQYFGNRSFQPSSVAVNEASCLWQRELESFESHMSFAIGDDYKNTRAYGVLLPRVHAYCRELTALYFPNLSLQAVGRNVVRLQEDRARSVAEVGKMIRKRRQDIEDIFAPPHVDDDGLYRQLKIVCTAQLNAYDEMVHRQMEELFAEPGPREESAE